MDRSGLVGHVAMALTDLRVPVYAMSARAVDNGLHVADHRHRQHRASEQRAGQAAPA